MSEKEFFERAVGTLKFAIEASGTPIAPSVVVIGRPGEDVSVLSSLEKLEKYAVVPLEVVQELLRRSDPKESEPRYEGSTEEAGNAEQAKPKPVNAVRLADVGDLVYSVKRCNGDKGGEIIIGQLLEVSNVSTLDGVAHYYVGREYGFAPADCFEVARKKGSESESFCQCMAESIEVQIPSGKVGECYYGQGMVDNRANGITRLAGEGDVVECLKSCVSTENTRLNKGQVATVEQVCLTGAGVYYFFGSDLGFFPVDCFTMFQKKSEKTKGGSADKNLMARQLDWLVGQVQDLSKVVAEIQGQ